MIDAWHKLGMSTRPVVLAPLCGVSDPPFRLICAELGAELTYVEMLSATALRYGGRRTYDMLTRDARETVVGVQVTGKTAEDVGHAVAIVTEHPFETIDLNMGCPVRKVVKNGGGSAILRDPARVQRTVELARAATTKPLSVKIRLGWDRTSITAIEVGQAIEAAGGEWITVHGRTRSDDYGARVDLDTMAALKEAVGIPVVGNGNLFTADDAACMGERAGVDGFMVSRGCLGNPWIFRALRGGEASVGLAEWEGTVTRHLALQREHYGDEGLGAICMRKHALWYLKGWPGGKPVKERVVHAESTREIERLIREFAAGLRARGLTRRHPPHDQDTSSRFRWDPKYDMDRQHDRGVGAEAAV